MNYCSKICLEEVILMKKGSNVLEEELNFLFLIILVNLQEIL